MNTPSLIVARMCQLLVLCCLFLAIGWITIQQVFSYSANANLVVNSTTDAVDSNIGDGICQTAAGECTLRAAIQESNALSGTDTIQLPTGIYTLTLSGVNENDGAFGDLDVLDELILEGADRETVIIDGNGQDRVIHTFARVSISGVTIRNGHSPDNLEGSGIRNEGTLTLSDVIVRQNGNNNEMADGQGVASIATLLIEDSIVEQNGGGFNSGRGGGVFSLTYETTTIENSIIRNNSGSYGGGIAIYENFGHLIINDSEIVDNKSFYGGGGILVGDAKATISNSTIQRNQIEDYSTFGGSGGGILGQSANMTIIDSMISDNFAAIEYFGHGGGGVALVSGFMIINGTTIRENTAGYMDGNNIVLDGFGGGILNFSGSSRISQSAIYSNTAGSGGGIFNEATLVVDNTTIGRNEVTQQGGGVYNNASASLMLLNVTVAENTAGTEGGGLWNSPTGSPVIQHTILGNNSASNGPDCFSTSVISSLGYNLLEDANTCPLGNTTTGNILNQDPLLSDLQDYGGSTLSFMPQAGSPVIDAADPAGCKDNHFVDTETDNQQYVSDQRGYVRVVDGDSNGSAVCDIGAVEAGSMELLLNQKVYLPMVLR
ncbi:MAG: choice-of-anchor Q domain-containing protein [Chloroflexota bacterium]